MLLASGPEAERETRKHLLSIRVDLHDLNAFSQAVAEAVQGWLSTQSPVDLGRQLEAPGEMSLGQVLEMFLIWHINAHCGEIATLNGCQGVQG